jgi:hypothetical protein
MSADTRKQKKANRAKKDRRSLKERRMSNKQIDRLAKFIVDNYPPPPIKHKHEYCHCSTCSMDFCIGADGTSIYCHECDWVQFNPNACLKRNEAPLKHTCHYCERR